MLCHGLLHEKPVMFVPFPGKWAEHLLFVVKTWLNFVMVGQHLMIIYNNIVNDPNMQNKIEFYLDEQVKSIKELSDYITQIKGLDITGLFIFNESFRSRT